MTRPVQVALLAAVLIFTGVGRTVAQNGAPHRPVTGSGAPGTVPIWTGPNSLGNSPIFQNGQGVEVSSTADSIAGRTDGESGTGVVGMNTSPNGNGGAGVAGYGLASSGLVWGVHGFVDSSPINEDAVGVQASGFNAFRAFSQTCPAVPCTPSAGTAGLFVVGPGGTILDGVATDGTTYQSVFNVDSNGNVFVAGNLSKGSGSFRIDHPLDPANRYLSHSFVESPDMMNIYNGMATLDANGEVWVTLPAYVDALNRDFRYHLTAVGAPAPNVHVAEEVADNRFKIAGGQPGGKISWQITGIREDAYANAHRIKVEEDKPVAERGKYLHPEVFGAPAESAVARKSLPVQRGPR